MRDPFRELLAIHDAAASHGCGLNPKLLHLMRDRQDQALQLQATPDVVVLDQGRAHSGCSDPVSVQQLDEDPKIARFPAQKTPFDRRETGS